MTRVPTLTAALSDLTASSPFASPPAQTGAAHAGAAETGAAGFVAPAGAARVGPDSHLTLHYRLSMADSGADVINTFEGKPATLQLGIGQMADALERRLLGLNEGTTTVFDLEPVQAFGLRNPELVQRVSRRMLSANSEPGMRYVPGDLLEFAGPHGDRFAGVLKEIDELGALFDFNHPLAGQRIRFEVRILGIL